MKCSQSLVARQYSKAYMLEFYDQLSLADMEHVKQAIYFFRRNHTFISLLSVITSMKQEKQHLIDDMCAYLSLHSSLKQMMRLLVSHKRVLYFPQVLQDIYSQYMKQASILHVDISSAQPLEPEELDRLEKFFAKRSGKKIISNVQVDPDLIAGIRMRSDLFLWEYSIAAKLKKLHHKLIVEG